MAKKPAGMPPRKPAVALRPDVKRAIERVWPDGVVDMTFDPDESYLCSRLAVLERALRRISGARLAYQLAAEGGSIWDEAADPEEDPPAFTENSRSYYLFFVCPEGDAFTFETETESVDEEALAELKEEGAWESEPASTVQGRAWTGCSVAISLLAPFAVISLSDMSAFDDGSTSEPGIEMCIQDREGNPIHPEEHVRELIGDKAFEILRELRGKIGAILGKHGIVVLPEEEWRKPASWLKGGEEAFVGAGGQPIRVLDAFFFEGL
jgi:hypothetical protein